jgi:hypothetical protein
MNTEEFKSALARSFTRAEGARHTFVDVNSGNLHREVGGYPGTSHRMPLCCEVMKAAMRGEDGILEEPPGGKGATLTIRYTLPR